jgi:hypothetical protein
MDATVSSLCCCCTICWWPNVSGAQLLLDVPVRQSSECPAHPARSRAVATVISAKPRGIIVPAPNRVAAANRSATSRPILPKGEAKSMSEQIIPIYDGHRMCADYTVTDVSTAA